MLSGVRSCIALACIFHLSGCATLPVAYRDYRAPDAPEQGAGVVEFVTEPSGAHVVIGLGREDPGPPVEGLTPMRLRLRPDRYTFHLGYQGNFESTVTPWFHLDAAVEPNQVDSFELNLGAPGRDRGVFTDLKWVVFYPMGVAFVLLGGGVAIGTGINTGYWGDWQGGLLAAAAALAVLLIWVAIPKEQAPPTRIISHRTGPVEAAVSVEKRRPRRVVP